jgi:hydroxyacylglutathione hydrolase
MYIRQLYTGCLSEAAYYIESEGEAAIVDPLRDIDVYIQLAAERKAVIKYIFETHFHADFVSGHLDLSKATGAPIIYGPETKTRYKVHVAKDGERFPLGKVSLEVLHTPGHTMESSCFLLYDESQKAHALFSGDTLFVGDVGRPDLAQKGEILTMEDLAGMLYDSLHKKILPLPNDVIIYPAHGAGSSCGKNIGTETQSTIGEQKQTNYALLAETKEAFIKSVTDGLSAPPQYFPINAQINKEGYDPLQDILDKALIELAIPDFKKLISEQDVVIIDSRPATEFVNGFVPTSLFLGLEGRFAEWAGSLLPFNKPLVLVTRTGEERETVIRLARVGFSNFKGFLEGGFEAWQKAGEKTDLVISIEADELAMDLPFDNNLVVLDVRRETEYADGHVKKAMNLPLQEMTDPGVLADFDDRMNLYVHCAGGYRSLIAVSLLKREGIHNLRNIEGGWNKIKEEKRIEVVKESSVLN